MASVAIYIIILLAVAAVVIVTSIILYNRHLDKVTRGEEHDTHSSLPEPGATVGITYKTVVMILLIAAIFSISALIGRIHSLQDTVSNQQRSIDRLSSDVCIISDQIAQNTKTVSEQTYEVLQGDVEKNTIEIRYCAKLKKFSDNTKLTLSLDGRDIELVRVRPGEFAATFTANLFETYTNPTLRIDEDGITTVESADFYGEAFWDYFPMFTYSCNFETSEFAGKYKYSGWYQPQLSNPQNVSNIQLTYISEGRELLTKDITEGALASERFELETDLKFGRDLVFRSEITTENGYKIVEESAMIFPADPDYEQKDFMGIYDKDGQLLWENKKL